MATKKIIVCDGCGKEISEKDSDAYKVYAAPYINEKFYNCIKDLDLCPDCKRRLAFLITGFITPKKSKTPSVKSLIEDLNAVLVAHGDIPVVSTSILPSFATPSPDGLYSPVVKINTEPALGKVAYIYLSPRQPEKDN